MSLGQLSSRGKQNNKLYQITVEIFLNSDRVQFCFYSTHRIDNFGKLVNFLLTCNNQQLKVFAANSFYQQDKFYIVTYIRYYSPTSITIGYYVNDGQGWRTGTFSNTTFFVSEV